MNNTRAKVTENIKIALSENDFHRKVEIGDPVISGERKKELVKQNVSLRDSFLYRVKNGIARGIADYAAKVININTKIVGMEYLDNIEGGAIITSNHFNHVDTTIIRKLCKRKGKRLYIVSQDTNLAMKGLVGFLMRNADTIPITDDRTYMKTKFEELIYSACVDDYLLIYPEQEMWFNYRKPRPLKRGAYHYAAMFNKPIISCFVEIRENYTLHILPPIYPDPEKSIRENSITMCEIDYRQKTEAYEMIYNKKLSYEYQEGDIYGE